MAVEIGIVGSKNSGKTTLIEQPVEKIVKRGLRVATVKHTRHDHRFDIEGKDSYRHRCAGSASTLAVSNSELALFSGPDESLQSDIIKLLHDRCDILLIEGDRSNSRPRVLLTRKDYRHLLPNSVDILASYGPLHISSDIPHFDLADLDGLVSCLLNYREHRQSEHCINGQ